MSPKVVGFILLLGIFPLSLVVSNAVSAQTSVAALSGTITDPFRKGVANVR